MNRELLTPISVKHILEMASTYSQNEPQMQAAAAAGFVEGLASSRSPSVSIASEDEILGVSPVASESDVSAASIESILINTPSDGSDSDREINSPAAASPNLRNPQHSSPAYYLFMNGTDTAYRNEPIVPEKDDIHPFSHLVQIISKTLSETSKEDPWNQQEGGKKCEAERGLAYESNSVALVNGPCTTATNKGERIAEGLLLALNAIARGKWNLQIIGHSRGAVESYDIIHELHRIKLALEDSSQSLRTVLLSSPLDYIKAGMAKMIGAEAENEKEIDTPEIRELLKEQLSNYSARMYSLDPVPGNPPLGLGWENPRFKESLPPEVKSVLAYACADERSSWFRPWFAPGVIPIVLPSDHAFIVGATEAHGNQAISAPMAERWNVRDYVYCNMLHRLQEATGLFDGKVAAKSIAVPGCNTLNKIVDTYCSEPATREKQLIEHLHRAISVESWSKELRRYSYISAGVGTISKALTRGLISLQSVDDYLGKINILEGAGADVDLGRLLTGGDLTLAQIPLITLVDELSSLLLGDLDSKFSSIIEQPLIEQVQGIKALLSTLISELSQYHKSKSNLSLTLANSFMGKHTHEAFVQRLLGLINRVAQTYLGGTLAESERAAFFDAIAGQEGLFYFLQTTTVQNTNPDVISKFAPVAELFTERLKHHVKDRYLTINSSIDVLERAARDYLQLQYDFAQRLEEYRQEPIPQEGAYDQKIQDSYVAIKTEILTSLNAHTVEQLQTIVNDAINADAGLSEVQRAELRQMFQESQAFRCLSLTDKSQITELFSKLTKLYEQATIFTHGYQQLQGLMVSKASSASAAVDAEPELPASTITARILEIGASIFARKQAIYDLRAYREHPVSTVIDEALYNTLRDKAINERGARPLDELDKLDAQIVQNQKTLQEVQASVIAQSKLIEVAQAKENDFLIFSTTIEGRFAKIRLLQADVPRNLRELEEEALRLELEIPHYLESYQRILDELKAIAQSSTSAKLLVKLIHIDTEGAPLSQGQIEKMLRIQAQKTSLTTQFFQNHNTITASLGTIEEDMKELRNKLKLQNLWKKLLKDKQVDDLKLITTVHHDTLLGLEDNKNLLVLAAAEADRILLTADTAVSSDEFMAFSADFQTQVVALETQLSDFSEALHTLENEQIMIAECLKAKDCFGQPNAQAYTEIEQHALEQSSNMAALKAEHLRIAKQVQDLHEAHDTMRQHLLDIETANSTDAGLRCLKAIDKLRLATTIYLSSLESDKSNNKAIAPTEKIRVVNALLSALDNPRASAYERVLAFDGILKSEDNRAILITRRDSAFRTFFEGVLDALIGLLTVVTLGIPYAIYCAAQKSPYGFFSSTVRGETFTRRALSVTNDVISNEPIEEQAGIAPQ